jgi:hypothetical protein
MNDVALPISKDLRQGPFLYILAFPVKVPPTKIHSGSFLAVIGASLMPQELYDSIH